MAKKRKSSRSSALGRTVRVDSEVMAELRDYAGTCKITVGAVVRRLAFGLPMVDVSQPKDDECGNCRVELNQPDDPRTLDCGGDCLNCMANAGDPDCRVRIAYIVAADCVPTDWADPLLSAVRPLTDDTTRIAIDGLLRSIRNRIHALRE